VQAANPVNKTEPNNATDRSYLIVYPLVRKIETSALLLNTVHVFDAFSIWNPFQGLSRARFVCFLFVRNASIQPCGPAAVCTPGALSGTLSLSE
jgi:hypothetical protein